MTTGRAITITQVGHDAIDARAELGCHIGAVCADAQILAADRGKPVRFEFNGVPMDVRGDETAVVAAARYSQVVADRAATWAASEDGQAEQRRQVAAATSRQAQIDQLVAALPESIKDMPRLIQWVGQFAEASDHAAMRYDAEAIADQLEQAGYRRDEGVGEREALQADRNRMGRYIVGQAIDMLRRGRGIHPVAATFAERFAAMPA